MKKFLKPKALLLRKQGHSFREISLILRISKSTASLWTSQEPLSQLAQKRIRELGELGRQRARKTNQRKRIKLWEEINKACPVLKNKAYGQDEYKIFLALLYWGEGAKTGYMVDFINSDQEMIRVYLFLLRKCFFIQESKLRVRLHLHEYHNQKEMISFWSKVCSIPKNQLSVYNKAHTGKNKKKDYKGCLSIRYGDSRILKEIFIIINRLGKLS